MLDEATSSVDTRTEVLIQQAMAQLRARPHELRDRAPALDHRERRPIVVLEHGARRRARQRTPSCSPRGGAYHALYTASSRARVRCRGRGRGRRRHNGPVTELVLGFGLPVSGAWATPANVADVARRAEEMGYGSLWTYQRLLAPADADWGPQYRSVLDPVVALAFAAGVTRRRASASP